MYNVMLSHALIDNIDVCRDNDTGIINKGFKFHTISKRSSIL